MFNLEVFFRCSIMILVRTRKYPLRGYILGSRAPGIPGIMDGVTLRAFLSPLRHMKQLLLVTSCDSPAGIGASLRTHGLTDGWTDRRDVGNSILDY